MDTIHSIGTIQSLAFLILWAGILFLFFNKEKTAFVFLALSIATSLYSGVAGLIATLPLAGLAAAVFTTAGLHRRDIGKYRPFEWLALTVTIILSYGLGAHLFPGFNNPLIVDNLNLSADALPFTLFWRYDKAIVAFGLLFLFSVYRPKQKVDANRWIISWMVVIMTPIIVLSLAVFEGMIAWNPKLPDFIFYWLLSNFFVASVGVEAFFRGIIQFHLCNTLNRISSHGWVIGVLLTGVVFGAVHVSGGIYFMAFAALAGIGYGTVFYLTNRLEMSILAHFLLNASHFILFTYPIIKPT